MFDIKSYQVYAQVNVVMLHVTKHYFIDSSSPVLHSISMGDLGDVGHLNCRSICHRFAVRLGVGAVLPHVQPVG